MKKEYIKDNGIVRECTSNIAKMNPFEYAYCKIKYWGAYRSAFDDLTELMFIFVESLIYIPIVILKMIFMPIVQMIYGVFKIHKSKTIMNEINNNNDKEQ